MQEVAPGIWIDTTTGLYYDDQGNTLSGDALNAAIQNNSDTSAAPGTTASPVAPGQIDPDPTHPGHYPGQTPPWISAGYPTFAAWSQAVGAQKAADEAYRQGQIALQQKQINATSNASGASIANARLAAQTAANDLAEKQREFDAGQISMTAYQAAQIADAQAKNALTQQQQQFDQFTKLSDLAANPRNFMQTFFLHRGFQPPAGSAAYGNGYALPDFMGGKTSAASASGPVGGKFTTGSGTAAPVNRAGGASTPGLFGSAANPNPMPTPTYAGPAITELKAGATTPTPISQYHAPIVSNGVVQGQGQGAVGQQFQGVMGTPIAFNDHADAAIVGAPGGLDQPKQLYGAGGPYYGPNNVNAPTAFAKGGITPEPIMGVGMHSNPTMFHALSQSPGHKYLIGEEGPEGVVPANYLPKFLQSRHGKQALMHEPMPSGDLASSDTNYGTNVGGMGTTYANGGVIAYGDGGMIGPPEGASGGDMMAMFAAGGPLGMPSQAMQAAMRSPLMGRTMDGGAMGVTGDITAFAGGGSLGTPGGYTATPEMQQDYAKQTQDYLAKNGSMSGFTPTAYSAPQPTTTTPEPAEDYIPPTPTPTYSAPASSYGSQSIQTGAKSIISATPNTSSTYSSPVTPAPAVTAQQPTATSNTNPYSTNPTYSGTVSPYDQLSQAGAIPPFLSRVMAQGAGNQAYGTNLPQMAYLPPGVPLVSQLAYDQMSPSEQQALQSYVSSYGVTPEDYLAQIKSQIGAAKQHRQKFQYTEQ